MGQGFTRTMVSAIAAVLMAGTLGITPGYAAKGSDASDKEMTAKTASSSSIVVPDYQYKLTKVGTYKGDKSSLIDKDGGMLVRNGDGYQIVGTDGKLVLDGKSFAECVYWGHGVYRVKSMDEDVNSNGLVTSDGKELLPCEAGMIKSLSDSTEEARFVEVVYSTGETESEDEAFFYTHEGFAVVMGPVEGDKLYTGYARIFDLQKGAFIDGVQLDEPATTVQMGDSFVLSRGGKATMYDSDGNTVWSKDDGVDVHSRCVVWYAGGKRQVFDSTGKGRYVTSENLDVMNQKSAWWSGDYLKEKNGNVEKAIDFDGKPVLKESFYYLLEYINGLFRVQPRKDDENRQLIALDGTVVLDPAGNAVEPIVPGYNTYWVDAQDTGIIKGADIIWKGPQDTKSQKLIAEKNGKYLTLNDEEYSLALDTAEGLKPGLVKGRDADSVAYGVYDLFTGKQLLKEEYDDIKFGADCVWAYANGSWTIYKAELQEK